MQSPQARHASRDLPLWVRVVPFVAAGVILLSGYIAVLVTAPLGFVPITRASSITLNTHDDNADYRNRIQIAKIGLEVPFYSRGGAELLDKGAWHRFPDRGDPIRGGNFILSAHRFSLGLTPQGTVEKSPFYNLHKLDPGDNLRIYFSGKWYDYTVRRMYSVKPSAVEIEAPSETAKLTLYTCSLSGAADGRLVVEATLAD